MKDAYSRVIDALNLKNQRLVENVQIFIKELQRITLLREETWMAVLSHMQHQVAKRLKQLRDEIHATERLSDLSEEEKNVIIADKRTSMSTMVSRLRNVFCLVFLRSVYFLFQDSSIVS